MCPLVEGFRNVSEPLLTCSVPYVQCNVAFVHIKAFDLKVDSDGAQIVRLKAVITVANKQTCFAHSTIPHHQVLQVDIALAHYYFEIIT